MPLYHKSKLVVAVENFPYQNILKHILGETLINLGGTVALKTTQPERTAFAGVDTEGKAAPIICYERSVLSTSPLPLINAEIPVLALRATLRRGSMARKRGQPQKGANFLAILTNDAWWRNTQGHKQLLSYTRLRAIETRRSVARSANKAIVPFKLP